MLTCGMVALLMKATDAQNIFRTDSSKLDITVNGKARPGRWSIDPREKPDVLNIDCIEPVNNVRLSDGVNFIDFKVKQGQVIDFIVLKRRTDTAHTRIVGIEPNVRFTEAYIREHSGKTIVDIPEVSELVNILMALHKDAEKDANMFDTKSDYYKRMKQYFAEYRNHPAIDTMHKYITGLKDVEGQDMKMFSRESYGYYFTLKMNACAYEFDRNGRIKNKGFIKEMAKGWYGVDPMKDIPVFEDFARKSSFRKFYKESRSFYDTLLRVYNQLNPIQKMQEWLDRKFGFGYGSYVVYFSPLVYGAHSTNKFESDNFKQTFMFIAPAEMSPTYNAVMNELLESRVVFTEIDHNYVNPVSDKMVDRINKAMSDRKKWAEGEITESYRNPYAVFNEYMTFGVYSLYVYDNYTAANLEEFLPKMETQMEKRRGFIRFKDFNQALLGKYKLDTSISMENLYEHMLNWIARVNEDI